jgi:hypothetical protein
MKKLIETMTSILFLSFLIISIFLILPAPAYTTEASDWKVVAGSDWQLIAESKDLNYYIDRQSIKEYEVNCSSHFCFPWYTSDNSDYPPDRFVRAWIKKIHKAPKEYEATQELDYQEHDCVKDKSRLLHLTKIYPDGINESVNLNSVIKWDSIPRDAIAKTLHAYLCNKR